MSLSSWSSSAYVFVMCMCFLILPSFLNVKSVTTGTHCTLYKCILMKIIWKYPIFNTILCYILYSTRWRYAQTKQPQSGMTSGRGSWAHPYPALLRLSQTFATPLFYNVSKSRSEWQFHLKHICVYCSQSLWRRLERKYHYETAS